ncbi:MAG: cupin domain-containing protein [Actinomycetes bacterium]|jgi:quercetin dioxygenase-like cupin family protein|nr:cupin [Acidimicrobiia bacterium]
MTDKPSPRVFPDLLTEVEVPENGTLSRVLHQDDRIRLVLFAFDTGQELTEHSSGSAAIVQVVRGHIRFRVGNETHDLEPSSWLYMEEKTPHALVALEPSVMLLTLLRR